MLFNSLTFALFLPLVFLLHWFLFSKNYKLQNGLLLFVSYIFYGWWDWSFLSLLFFSTFLDYYAGLKIQQASSERESKIWLILSIAVNLGFLGFFKYYNFFITEFSTLLQGIGFVVHPWTLKIILPVGISFYTFHGLSYIIDIYKKKTEAIADFVDYAVFVCYFPLLVAGPIERATHLLPQFQQKRTFNTQDAVNGLRQMLWGLFKKIVIADNCAFYANQIFSQSDHASGSTLFVGALFFTVQIYGDFSGYSDIALGCSRLFGIELMRNFAFPYFSRDIAEFWRRWHISLSSWFRDYLYIPLGGSAGGTWMKVRNTFIIFIVSGFWHGANWTFIFWGFLNAVYFLPLLLLNRNRVNIDTVSDQNIFPSLRTFFQIMVTFLLTVFAWIFFRSDSIGQAFDIIGNIFSPTLFTKPQLVGIKDPIYVLIHVLMIGILFGAEWVQRSKHHALQFSSYGAKNRVLRWSIYSIVVLLILLFGGKQGTFIYFQF
ncbi:MAG: membrane-bound O-acyltransferase family protein [Flavobacterium sp. BFFFF2]|nr:MAG: membrane-bound O-acyltransferase family protein [Flavobacterium sp. BFFFF2]